MNRPRLGAGVFCWWGEGDGGEGGREGAGRVVSSSSIIEVRSDGWFAGEVMSPGLALRDSPDYTEGNCCSTKTSR